MKDKMKDLGKLIQEQKPSGNDVKCAEIKSIPTSKNGYSVHGEKQKNFFKIGEYNRATASFEMNSTEDVRGGGGVGLPTGDKTEMKPKFDLSSDAGHYFKSSFARSMVSSNKSKSMDYALLNRNGYAIKEESPPRSNSGNGDDSFWMVPGKENWDLRRAQPAEVRDDESTNGSFLGVGVGGGGDQPTSMKKSDIIEEHLRNQGFLLDRPGSRTSSTYQRCPSGYNERRFDDVLLRSPLTASCRSSFHRSYSSASDVDSVMLQSQVTTLQWQLRQAEASRQMYRAVMEQVVSFLQKTHKNLDLLQNRLNDDEDDDDVDNVTRVPRSRSVHAVDTSPTTPFTSPRSETNLSFKKAKSFAQIGDPDCPKHGTMYREMCWRKGRKQQHDSNEVNPSKLSEEAFRLLRTVKSLLNTREPDLTSRLSASCSSPANIADVSSASSTVSATLDSDHSDHFQTKETGVRRSPPAKDLTTNGVKECRRVGRGGGGGGGGGQGKPGLEAKGSPPQLSISSKEDDESGFSSLNSFQEIGLPVTNSTFLQPGKHQQAVNLRYNKTQDSFQEVGLPKVDDPANCKVHRRWSSTPTDGHLSKLRPPSLCTNGDVIRVLWV